MFKLFSERLQPKAAQSKPLYRYDVLPEPFRNQVVFIWKATAGIPRPEPQYGWDEYAPEPASNCFWEAVRDKLQMEKGIVNLGISSPTPVVQYWEYFSRAAVSDALDALDLCFCVIDGKKMRELTRAERQHSQISMQPDEAIAELNKRFEQHSLGYRFTPGVGLMRVDSEFIHTEVVQPAIELLRGRAYRGPLEEFHRAHEHYRQGRYKESMNAALNAFESTMKAICDKRKWKYSEGASSAKLVELIVEKELVPKSLLGEFNALRSLLESGLPTVRNKLSGHGQGLDIKDVPAYIARFALSQAATNIILLIEADEAKK